MQIERKIVDITSRKATVKQICFYKCLLKSKNQVFKNEQDLI